MRGKPFLTSYSQADVSVLQRSLSFFDNAAGSQRDGSVDVMLVVESHVDALRKEILSSVKEKLCGL